MAPYTASTPPRNSDIAILRPQLSSWTARLWQIGTTNESFPMLKLGGGIELRRIEDRQLADTLRPFESGLRKTVRWYLDHQDWAQDVMSGEYRSWVAMQYAT